MKTVNLSLGDYSGQIIYIAFRHWDCTDQYALVIDDVEIHKVSGTIDGEVVEILSPKSGENLTSTEEVKVLLRNNGADAIQEYTLKLEVNGSEIAFDPNPIPISGMDEVIYTFDAPVNLSEIGQSYEIKVTISVEDDQVTSNDTKVVKVASFSSDIIELLGYGVYYENYILNRHGFVKFDTNNPQNITYNYELANDTLLMSGEYLDNNIYCYSARSGEGGYVSKNFVKISADTYEKITITPVNDFTIEMAYDYKTETMYGITYDAYTDNCNLVTINLETGMTTEIGSLESIMFTLACSQEGQLYGIDGNGYYCSIDKRDATVIKLNHTGLLPMQRQSMAFDHNTGRLFWAMQNEHEGKLIEIHPSSGIVLERGNLGNNVTILALHTPYLPVGINNTSIFAGFRIYPNPTSGLVNISISEKSVIRIIDMQGKLLETHYVTGDTVLNLKLTKGIYIIQIETDKTVYNEKLIIRNEK
jgi:hypothetical protein